MCGIFAAMTRQGVAAEHRDAALKALYHRGPDGAGSWTSNDGRLLLGHTRLSIIGLRLFLSICTTGFGHWREGARSRRHEMLVKA